MKRMMVYRKKKKHLLDWNAQTREGEKGKKTQGKEGSGSACFAL
jgi:hypothetical protein